MGLARSLCRRVVGLVHGAYVLRRIRVASEAEVHGLRLVTDPEVFHPGYFHSTGVLAEWLGGRELRGKRFLDMGTGSGAIGILAAGRGAEVTAADVNPRAVALARENARRNGVTTEVVESDLFAGLGGRMFDVIAFNLPFYPGRPRTPFEAAFYAGPDFETVRAFAAGSARQLAPEGALVVVFSEDSGRDRMVALFEAAGFHVAEERVTRRLLEELYVVRFSRGEAPALASHAHSPSAP
jgi:release factor glutamine methyltransferase